MQEYANAIVMTIKEVCDVHNVRTPILITESGRAVTAHHSVLISPILGRRGQDELSHEMTLPNDAHEAVRRLFQLVMQSTERQNVDEVLEIFHEAREKHDETHTLFTQGHLSLEERAMADQAFWSICQSLLVKLQDASLHPQRQSLH